MRGLGNLVDTDLAPKRLRAAVEGVTWGSSDTKATTSQSETSSADPPSLGALGA